MENTYSKVIYLLVNYREFKQRLKIIEIKLETLNDKALQKDIKNTAIQTSRTKDYTAEIAIDKLEGKLKVEYNKKKMFVKRVEVARDGLAPIEKFVINTKYLKGSILPDVEVYTDPKFKYGKTKYYDIKNKALTKMGRIMGYINK